MTSDKNDTTDMGEAIDAVDGGRRSIGATIGALLGFAAVSGLSREAQAQSVPIFPTGAGMTDVFWAEDIFALREYSNAAQYQMAVLKGFSSIGDGGEGVFVWDALSTAADNTGIVICPNANKDGNLPGRWIRVVDGDWNVCWFGAKGDGIANNDGAFRTAIDEMAYLAALQAANGRVLYVPPGKYNFAQTLYVDKAITLKGSGGVGAASVFSTWLLFPPGVTGIEIGRVNANSVGNGATIRDVYIEGKKTGVANANAHGIKIRQISLIDNVRVSNFDGNGIDIFGDIVRTQTNTAHSSIQHCQVQSCTMNGIYVDGDDASACLVSHTDVRNCSGWGVYDTSFFGNTYVGLMLHTNAAGAYRVDGTSNRSLLLGCYSEADQPTSNFFDSLAMAIGGLHAAGVVGWQQSRGELSSHLVNSVNTVVLHDANGNAYNASEGWAGLGSPHLMSMKGADDVQPYSMEYHSRYTNSPAYMGWYAWKWAGSNSHVAFAIGGTQAGDAFVGRAWVPFGMYFGVNARLLVSSTATKSGLPTNPIRGNVYFSNNASATGDDHGVAFWQCVAEAVGATPAKYLPVKHSVYATASSLPRKAQVGDVVLNAAPGLTSGSSHVAQWHCVQSGDGVSTVARWRAVKLEDGDIVGIV